MTYITDALRDELRAAELPVWATIIPDRAHYGARGAVKLHKRVNHARSAVTAHSNRNGAPEAEIYKLIDGEWHLEWRIEAGTPAHKLPWKDQEAEALKLAKREAKAAEAELARLKSAADAAQARYLALKGES